MNEILDSTTNSLAELVEEYISQKRDRKPSDTAYFKSKLQRLGYLPSQVDDLLIEMDDDADKELLAGDGLKKAKLKLIVSLIVGFAGMTISIAAALVGIFGFTSISLMVIPFGIIGGSFIVAGKAYSEIGSVKKRKKRRSLKYQKWS